MQRLVENMMRMMREDMSQYPDDTIIKFRTGDGKSFNVPLKIFKMWTIPFGQLLNVRHPCQLPGAQGAMIKLVIEWCKKHQDDVRDPSIDGPNHGITAIDDIPDWDKKFMSKLSDYDLDVAIEHSMGLGIKPLFVLLVKETFNRRPNTVEYVFNTINRLPGEAGQVSIKNPVCRRPPSASGGAGDGLVPGLGRSLIIVCGDGQKFVANVKAMKKWKRYSEEFVYGDEAGTIFTFGSVLSIPEVSSLGMKWIIEWGERHEDDPDIDDVSGLPNLGITAVDDVPDWDKQFIMRMSRNEMKMALGNCTRLNLQPLMILLLKMMFQRYNLVMVVMKDVRDLTKKLTIHNPTIKHDE